MSKVHVHDMQKDTEVLITIDMTFNIHKNTNLHKHLQSYHYQCCLIYIYHSNRK